MATPVGCPHRSNPKQGGDDDPRVSHVAQLYFNAVADFQKAMGVHGKEIMGDVKNYTDIPLQVQISEILG